MKQVKPATLIQFFDDPEIFEMLNVYRKLSGWTWKRLFLIGVAETLHKQSDNQDLLLVLIDYLEGRR